MQSGVWKMHLGAAGDGEPRVWGLCPALGGTCRAPGPLCFGEGACEGWNQVTKTTA